MKTEQPRTVSEAPRSGSYLQKSVILVVVIAMAGISYVLRQNSIRNDEKAGEEKRKKVEAEQNPESMRERQLELTRITMKQFEDSLAQSGDTSLYIPLGNMRYNLGDEQGALKMYEEYVTKINPANLLAKTDYGYILFNAGRHEDGKRITREVVATKPTYQLALYNLGFMFYQEEHFDEAARWMHLALKADSSSEVGKQAQLAFDEFKRKSDSVKTVTK